MNPLTKLKLTRREKYYVYIGACVVIMFLIINFVLFPFFDATAKMKRSVQTNENILHEIRLLSSEYMALKIDSKDVERALGVRQKDFALFTFLEQQAGRAGVKTNIKNMKPSTSSTTGPYKESSVEMMMEGVTLKQLVNYLYLIESPQYLVSIKRISLRKSKSNPEYLTVLIHAITYE
jgi:general secretion pathway protein M